MDGHEASNDYEFGHVPFKKMRIMAKKGTIQGPMATHATYQHVQHVHTPMRPNDPRLRETTPQQDQPSMDKSHQWINWSHQHRDLLASWRDSSLDGTVCELLLKLGLRLSTTNGTSCSNHQGACNQPKQPSRSMQQHVESRSSTTTRTTIFRQNGSSRFHENESDKRVPIQGKYMYS